MISKLSGGRALLIIGLLAYVIFAVVRLPASLAVTWFVPDEIKIGKVQGTVWTGHANIIVTPHATLVNTSWTAKPLSLFTGKMSYRINTTVADGAVNTRLFITPGGNIILEKLTGVLSLSALPAIVPTVTLNGRIGLDFARLKIADKWLVDAEGTVDIVGLTVIDPVNESLGNFEVVFNGVDESGLVGQISDLDGPLGVIGTLSLQADKQWQLVGNVRPTSAASDQVVQGLAFLGSRNSDGSYALSYPLR